MGATTLAAEDNVLVPVLPELIVGIIAFSLLCFVLMKYVFPKMEETFQARVEAIEGGIKKAEEAQAEANQLLAQYKQQLAQASAEAARIRDETRADAVASRDEILARAAEDRDRIIAAGKDQLLQEREGLVRQLRGELGALAVELSGRIVGESLADEARQRGTVDRFLAELDAQPAAGAR